MHMNLNPLCGTKSTISIFIFNFWRISGRGILNGKRHYCSEWFGKAEIKQDGFLLLLSMSSSHILLSVIQPRLVHTTHGSYFGIHIYRSSWSSISGSAPDQKPLSSISIEECSWLVRLWVVHGGEGSIISRILWKAFGPSGHVASFMRLWGQYSLVSLFPEDANSYAHTLSIPSRLRWTPEPCSSYSLVIS